MAEMQPPRRVTADELWVHIGEQRYNVVKGKELTIVDITDDNRAYALIGVFTDLDRGVVLEIKPL